MAIPINFLLIIERAISYIKRIFGLKIMHNAKTVDPGHQ